MSAATPVATDADSMPDGPDMPDTELDEDLPAAAGQSASATALSSPVAEPLALPAEAIGQRLDVWLAAHLPDYSRVQVKRMIEAGLVRWHKPPRNGAKIKVSYLIQGGEELWVQTPPPRAQAVLGESIPLQMIFEDAAMAVVDKPAGLVVHPGAGVLSGTLANALVGRYGALAGSTADRPGIVHRLDRETSGLIAVARNEKSLRNLMAQFEARTVRKVYLALAHGRPADEFTVEAAIGRHPTHRLRMAIMPPGQGRGAVTHFQTLLRFSVDVRVRGKAQLQPFALLACFPKTGRTHQLRVHLKSVDCSILADGLYGQESRFPLDPKAPAWIQRQALHAYRLALNHPVTGERLQFTAPVPADMAAVLDGWTAASGGQDWRQSLASAALDAN